MDNYKDFAEASLAADIATTDETAVTVTSGTPFPAAPFRITIGTEIMHVTSKGGGTDWTVVRGYDSSTADVHASGDKVEQNWASGDVADLAALIEAKLPLAGGTLVGPLNMDNGDVTLVRLLTLHGEIDDGGSGTTLALNWNLGGAQKVTLTGNPTFAFEGSVRIFPQMTSNTAPSGVASDSTASGYAYYPFRNSDSGYGDTYPVNGWVKYDFGAGNGAIANAYNINHAPDCSPCAWKVQGSQDNTNWIDLDIVTGNSISTTQNFLIDTPDFYRYYRILFTASSGVFYLARFDPLIGFANPPAPCFLTLKLVQDGTGGRVITWPATVKGTPAINLASGAVSNVLFYWDGTYYWTLNGKQFVSATDKILGRSTAGAGAEEEIPCTAAARSIFDDTTVAAILATLGGAPLAPTAAAYTPATGAQTVALNVATANMHVVSGHASGTAITFTVAGATNNQSFMVSILQGGTTVSTITAWFATIRWAGGTAPTLTATVGKRDTFRFIRTGANTYDGFVVGQNC